jgi:hypothetical protein
MRSTQRQKPARVARSNQNCLRPSSPKTALYRRRLIRVLLKQSLTLFARGIRSNTEDGADLCRSAMMGHQGLGLPLKPVAAAHFAYAASDYLSVKPWRSRWKSASLCILHVARHRSRPKNMVRPKAFRQEFPCDIFAIPKSFPAHQIRDAEWVS